MISVKLEEFIDTRSLEKLGELHELLNEERLSAKDTEVNYRVINHWDEKGIIRFTRDKKESNRKFSFVDFMWIKIVNELRSFGVQLPAIKKIADDIYEPLPMKELFFHFAGCMDEVLKDFEGDNKEELLDFFKSGEYKNADYDILPLKFNYLHILIAEVIATRKSVSIIVFNDGEWLPYIKENEHLYPPELLYKKEFSSQVRINLTELIFKFIVEDYLIEYFNGLNLFTPQERKLLYYIKEGDYKKVFVLFKSKKNEPIEIVKSKTAQEQLIKILREKEYREFILIDKKNNEFRIREGEQGEALEYGDKINGEKEKTILIKNERPGAKRKFKVIKIKE
jgi:DNA-binding transcriptional MerR regulator